MTCRAKLVLSLATLALALPLNSAFPQNKKDWRRERREQKQERKEDRREQRQNNQQQQQNNQQNPQSGSGGAPSANALPPQKLIGPGPHAGDWLRRFREMPADQQERQLESDPNFHKLPPQQQQNLKQRLQWFNSRPPDQQQRILERMETREHLTPEQKLQERQLFQRYQGLPFERRRAVHNALVDLNAM